MISTLAEGIDPTTGELLPEANVINKVEIVQALYTVLNYLDEKETKMNVPENAGKPWTKKDEKLLVDLYRSGAVKKGICNTLHRTETGIAARLVHLGVIESRDVFRARKWVYNKASYQLVRSLIYSTPELSLAIERVCTQEYLSATKVTRMWVFLS